MEIIFHSSLFIVMYNYTAPGNVPKKIHKKYKIMVDIEGAPWYNKSIEREVKEMAYEEVLKDLDRLEEKMDKVLKELEEIRKEHNERVRGKELKKK